MAPGSLTKEASIQVTDSSPTTTVYSSLPPSPGLRKPGVPKRIIVCCDGTWQDEIISQKRWQYTNILKLSRMINHQDVRHDPPIHQIVFYQAGVGTDQNFYSEYVDGATGASLVAKVEEAYAFISHNYHPGDEIFLFGFSRGAYTARMTAAFIGEIGVLDKKDMDHFVKIFVTYQKIGHSSNKKEIAKSKEYLERWTNSNAKGKLRADLDGDSFTIKCLGVFDTVGSIGLPSEIRLSRKSRELFGFPDKLLGAHVENAFHAMAMNETRTDFNVARFEQTDQGRERGQVLKQVWFAGCHSDIGGGYQAHDLADITLTWMASNIDNLLSLDHGYLNDIPRPTAPWGTQIPNNPETGIFKISSSMQRTLPTETNDRTHEYIHPSILSQTHPSPILLKLLSNVDKNPKLVCPLAPLEKELQTLWPRIHSHRRTRSALGKLEGNNSLRWRIMTRAKTVFRFERETVTGEGDVSKYEKAWVESNVHEVHATT
ncbi:hypothetical protein K439DRAFT_1362468 [Ramaria rubella]|nr:hypothetical protein K439DRAFT_1362468 [Ramaria rubella]